ncbi:LamG-like jellyroll fold domain-containing protein [Endozoicomonas acroporae]|uniref:LamG-like jellyroll fold domain-containing protein n=1 Tax=Endozoicomonas acroporae TaxID=1701104 RepID=UPI003D78CC80
MRATDPSGAFSEQQYTVVVTEAIAPEFDLNLEAFSGLMLDTNLLNNGDFSGGETAWSMSGLSSVQSQSLVAGHSVGKVGFFYANNNVDAGPGVFEQTIQGLNDVNYSLSLGYWTYSPSGLEQAIRVDVIDEVTGDVLVTETFTAINDGTLRTADLEFVGRSVGNVVLRISDASANHDSDVEFHHMEIDNFVLQATSEKNPELAAGDIEDFLTTLNIDESAEPGSVIDQIEASIGNNETLTFSLTDDANGLFTIDASTGEISLVGALDDSVINSYPLTVRVASPSGMFTEQQYTVSVARENTAPEFDLDMDTYNDLQLDNNLVSNGDFSTLDDWTLTGTVGLYDNRLAFNGGNNPSDGVVEQVIQGHPNVNYTLSLDYGAGWSAQLVSGQVEVIDQASGDVLAISTFDNDSLTMQTMNLEFTARSAGNLVLRITDTTADGNGRDLWVDNVTLQATSGNNPELAAGDIETLLTTMTVSEDAGTGTFVTQLQASDNEGNTLTFSLADDADGIFAIDAATGVITIGDGSKLDYETNSQHIITARVTDADGAYSDQSLTIKVDDANNAPEIITTKMMGHSPVAAFEFDEGTGTTADDSYSNTSLTLSGSAAWGSGRSGTGSAFEMDGTTGSGEISGLTTGGAMTISSWVRFDSFAQNWSRVFDFGDGSGDNNIFLAHKGTTNEVVFNIRDDNGTDHGLSITDFFPTAEWVHVTATVDSSGQMSVYKNGELAGTHLGGVPPVMERTNNYVGKSNWDNDGYMDGAIDDLVILNEALDPSQVSALYQANQLSDFIEIDIADAVITPEATVNSTTDSNQHQSAIAATPDGGAIEVWLSESGGTYAIMGRHSPGGAEFKINTNDPTGDHSLDSPDITVLENGHYVVAWNYIVPGVNYTPRIKVYDTSGAVITDEVAVGSDDYNSSLTTLSGNRFALLNMDPDGHNVSVNILDDSGNSLTTFDAGSANAWDWSKPAMTELDNGNYAIVWRNSTSGSDNARLRIFDSSGNATISEISFGGNAANSDHALTMDTLGNGQVIAAYQSGDDVYFQRWHADGTAAGGPVLANSTTAGIQSQPDIIALGDGSFYITWTSENQDGDGKGIYGRHFAANGMANSTETLINETTTGNQSSPHVMQLADGTLQVTWTSDQNGNSDIFSRTLTIGNQVTENVANGTIVGQVTATDMDFDAITFSLPDDADGRFAIDQRTGVITVKNGSKLDYETDSQHTITARATDADDAYSDQSLTIKVNDANDAPEIITTKVITHRPVAAFEFDEGTGTTADDASHNSTPLTLSGSATWGSSQSGTGSAFEMDGSLGGGEISGLQTGGAMTITSWVRFDSFDQSWSRVVDFGNGAGDNNIFLSHADQTNGLAFAIWDDTGTEHKLTIDDFFTPTEWVHVTATVDSSGLMSVYKNGELAGTHQGGVPPVMERTNNYVGKSNWDQNGYMDGAIDDLAIFNEALVPSQISALYQANQLSGFIEVDTVGVANATEHMVNITADSHQHQSAIAATADGGAIAVWLSESYIRDGVAPYTIVGRHYPDGSEFTISAPEGVPIGTTLGSPNIVVLENGNYVVTWDRHDRSGTSPWLKVYDASGAVITEKMAAYNEHQTNLTELSGNRFALLSMDPDSGHTAKVMIFDASGNTLNTFNAGWANHWSWSRPDMTELDNGNYAVVWRNNTWGSDSARLRIFNSNGHPATGEVSFGGDIASSDAALTIETLGNGQVVAAYQSGDDVYFQRWSADGTAEGDPVLANTTTAGIQSQPDIIALDDGSFYITWTSENQDGDGNAINGRHFAADGMAISSETLINKTTTGDQSDPQLVQLADGTLQVFWTSSQNGNNDVFSRELAFGVNEHAANGITVGQVMATDAEGDAITYSLTNDADGRFAFDSSTGVITVRDASRLDYATDSQHTITIRATDANGAYSDQLLTIMVNNVNDAPEIMTIQAIDYSPLATFEFDEGVGATADDAINNNTSLTLSGSAAWGSGRSGTGSAFEMDGSTGAGEISGLKTGGAMTISSWVRFDSFDQNWSRVVDFGNGSGDHNIILAHESNTNALAFIIYDGNGAEHKLTVNDFFPTADWVHVTATVDSSGLMSIYKNGEPAGTHQGVVPSETVRTNNYVGKSNWDPDGYMDGAIDDLAIFDEALDASQVSALYQADQPSDFIEVDIANAVSAPEDNVNTTTDSDQHQSAIAATPDGGAIEVWLSESGGTYAIMGRHSPGGAEFKINTNDPTGDHSLDSPDITVLENGHYVVAWNYIVPGVNYTPRIKVYDASGAVITDEVAVGSDDYNSSLTALSGNRFALLNMDPDGHNVSVNILDDSGNSLTTFDAGSANAWDWSKPAMTELDNGNYAIVWRNSISGSDNARLRIFDSSGNATISEISFGGNAANSDHALTMDTLGNGQVIAAYQSGDDVYLQRWHADGTAAGGPVLANSTTAGIQSQPDIIALGDGSFYITWTSENQDGDGKGIYGRHFAANGMANSTETLINETTTGNQSSPHVVQLADGTLQVSWTSDQNGNSDIFSRTLTIGNQVSENVANGTIVGQVTATDMDWDAITFSLPDDADGRFAIDQRTGVITVKNGSKLDYETDSQHTITARATDVNGAYSDQQLIINVNNAWDEAPEIKNQQVMADSLAAAFKFDEGAGTTADDVSNNNTPLTLSGSAGWGSGRFSTGSAFEMDGTTGSGEISGLTTGGAMTISSWVRFDSFAQNWSRVFDFGDGSGDNNIFLAHKGTTNEVVFNIRDDNGTDHGLSIPDFFPTAEWVHVTATVDSSGQMSVYKNGELAGTHLGGVPPVMERTNNYVGKSNWDNDGYMDGAIDDLVILNESLTADAASELYHQAQADQISEFIDNHYAYHVLDNAPELDENAQPGTTVGQVRGIDSDGDTISYSLTDSADGRFAIDASTGVITVAGALDYETATSHELTVRVTQQNGEFDEQLFVVSVKNDQNLAAVLQPQDTAVAAFDFAHGSGLVSEDLTEHNLDLTFNNGITRTDGGVNLNSVGGSIGAMTLGGDMTIATTFTFHSHGNWARVVELSNGPSADNIIIASPSEGRIEANIYHGANMVGSVGFDNFYTLGETFHVALAIDDNGHMHLYKNGVEVADNPDAATPTVMARSSNLVGLSSFSQDAATDGSVKDLIIVDQVLDAHHISDLYSLTQSGQIEVFLNPLHITENAAIGTEVGQVHAEDPEGNSLSFSLTDDAGGLFAIDAGTGVIRLAGDLNHTEASSHQVTVRVTDHPDGAFHEKQYEISVADHNYAPQFLPEGGSGALVAYDFAQGSGEVAEDLTYHNQDLTFNSGISRSGDGVALNSVGGSLEAMTLRGDITIASTFTYHSHSNWARLVDFGNGAGTDNILIASPSEGQIQAQIFHGNQIVGSVASDNFYTLGETFHLALTVDDDGHIHLYKNGVQVADNPNGQGPSGIELTSNLVGKSNWSQDAATDGTVKDLVVFDRSLAPDSISALYQQTQIGEVEAFLSVSLDTIAESALPGTVVGRALVSDVDGDNLTFSLTDDAGGLFAINAATGDITVASTLDYDSASSHQLTVRVADPSGAFSEQTYVVAVAAAPELLPERGSDALVAFDFANGSGEVAEDLTEHNRDLTFNSGITHSDDGVRLNSVGGSLGDITLSGDMTIASTFTYHSHSPWARLVDLGNGAGTDNILIASPSEGRIEVQIFHGNNIVGSVAYDNFYTLDETFHLALTVDADGHMHLYKNGVEVADNPNGQGPSGVTLSSSLVGQSNWPQDTATDGTVKDLIILDRSLDPGSISDLYGQTQSGHIEVFLASADIVESALPGDVVGQMQASDPAGEELTFSLTNNAGGLFTIDAATGEISLAGTLDYETATSHSLTVRVTNSSGGFSEQLYVVSVRDAAELLPVHEANDALAAFDFTTGSGEMADSLTNNGQDLTFNSGITRSNDGVRLNSVGGSLGAMTLSGDMTIASTFTYHSHGNWARIIDFGNGPGNDNILIGSPSEGRIEAHVFHGNTMVGSVAFDNFFTLDETFHMALTVDADGHMHLYKNGVEVADNPNGQGPSGVSLTSNLVGQSNWSGDAATDGTVTDLVVLDRALDPGSISDLYDQAQSGDIESFLTSLETIGTDSADIIKADSGSNTLLGEAGDDILFGGAGNDTLTGGTGSDTFTWEAPDLGTAAAPAEDVITDFHLGQGGDVIHLDDILPSDHGDLDQYLALNFDNGDTTLEITPQVGGDITQKIRLEGVDMSVLGNTDAEIINNLINNGNLSLD